VLLKADSCPTCLYRFVRRGNLRALCDAVIFASSAASSSPSNPSNGTNKKRRARPSLPPPEFEGSDDRIKRRRRRETMDGVPAHHPGSSWDGTE
jgi:hypothetical protein